MTRPRKNGVTVYPRLENGDDNLDLEEILYLNSLKDRTQGIMIVDEKGNETFSPCAVWTGTLGTRGYGQFSWKGKQYFTHRLSYTLNKGPIPPHQYVCHECDNPACINPDHLWAGTQADNMLDKELRGRGSQPKGTDHGNSKLSEADVLEIRRLWKTGQYLQRDLAKWFGVSHYAIHCVVNYKLWKHLP